MSENPASDSFMNDHSREANELFASGSDHHQDYTRHPWSEGPIDYHNENEPNANNIPGISGDFNFTSGEESNVMTSDIDNFSVSNNSPAREMTSNVNNTSNISPNSSVGSNIAAPSVDASHEESAGTNTSLGNESYFDQPINQLTLNDRAYFANYYPYITSQSNLPGGNQTTLNNGTYTLTLPAATNNPVRIDPSLLNYEQNVPVQGSSNYGQTGYVNNPVSVNSNPVANYWNEDVHAQISRGLPSNYYSTIPTTTSYEQFVLNSNGRSIVADAMRDYITLGDSSLTNKGKKKRGRKPESDYTHVIPLPSPSSTDGNRQEIAQCSNCGVRDTPAWRRDLQGVALLCNACGLYLKNKGVYRPTEIAPDGTVRLMRTQRPEPEFACHNCGTRNTPCWRGPEGQKLCNKCGLFLKQHGYARPPSSPKSVRYNSY